MKVHLLLPLSLGLLLVGECSAQEVKDFTNVDVGVKKIEPRKDPKTGFIVGGVNKTAIIKGLTEINGLSIARLEKIMRPGAGSRFGFLGKDENLLDVLAADNKYVVDDKGLTHQELALHMRALAAIGAKLLAGKNKEKSAPFLYHGKKYQVEIEISRGIQPSPFDDDTKSGTNVTVYNLTNGKKLFYGLLVPYMAERYGFYEGKGTSFRVEPGKVLEVLDFLAVKGKKE